MTREHYDGPLQLGEDLLRFHVGEKVTMESMVAQRPPSGMPESGSTPSP